jgi:hypothetical protein
VKLFRLVLTLIFTASLFSLPGGAGQMAAAQTSPPPPLFMNTSGPAVSAASADPTLARYRYVAINRLALKAVLDAFKRDPAGSALLGLAFFPDAAYTARIERVQRTFTGGYVLSGVLDGVQDSEVGLALEGMVLVGHASLPGGHYTLGYTREGVQYVGQVKRGQAPLSNDAILPPGKPEISSQDSYGDDDGSYIDVMVVYTPAILDNLGGADSVQAAIDDLVTETNQGYQNSQVNQRVRVVHAEEVDYDESTQSSNSLQTILDQLTTGTDGILDQVQGLRDTYAADLVVMLVNNVDPNYAGIAWLMGPGWDTHGFEPYAYSVVTDFWYSNFYVFGHEMGHNMGAQHDRAHSGGNPGAYPYSYGYCLPGNVYHTIMAYNGPCTITINYWSNPAITYAGVATGVTDSEDNHRTLNNTAPVVAQFRDGPYASAAPTDLTATAASPSQVTLYWTDNGMGETNLRVERASQAGGVWGAYSEVASALAASQDWSDTSVVCNTSYRYRLRAYYAGDGFTAYSNVTEVTPSCFPPAPTGLTATAGPPLPYQVVLNWTEINGNQTGFRVERLDSGVWTSHGTTGAAVTTFTDSSVACGHDYQYRVWAYNDSGDSLLPSNSAAASILPCPPTGLSLTTLSQVRINLQWNDTSQNEDGFRIERSPNSLPYDWSWFVNVGSGVTTYSDASLACGTSYVYRVWAFKAGQDSISPSNEATGATQSCNIPPAPTGVTALARNRTSIRLNWTDIDGEDYYAIERLNGSTWVPVGSTLPQSNATTFVDQGLAPDTQYSYRIYAHNNSGDSPYVTVTGRTYVMEYYLPFFLKK